MADHQTTSFYRRNLPHWEVRDGTYFVTMCLHGTLPVDAERNLWRLSQEIKGSIGERKSLLQRRLFATIEKYLHESKQKCCFENSDVARMVMDSIENVAQRGIWEISSYAIMPNHIHLLVFILQKSLKANLTNFKRWTGRQAVRILGWDSGPFWQDEAFDHWIRTQMEYERIIEYIQNNPVKAGLVKDYRDWPYASWQTPPDLSK